MNIAKCNVNWSTPSADSLGSMPIGNGDLGANVWVTDDGRVHLYLSKTDAWDEYCRLLKLGELTVTTEPSLSDHLAQGFAQALCLPEGWIELRFGAASAPALRMRLWVDAHRPVLWGEVEGEPGLSLRCRLRTWRTRYRELPTEEAVASMCQDGEHAKAFEYPDQALSASQCDTGQIGLYHRNQYSVLPELLKHQQMPELIDQVDDPVVDRTFGCLVQAHAQTVHTGGDLTEQILALDAPKGRAVLSVVAHCDQTDSLEQWLAALQSRAAEACKINLDTARNAHKQWWHHFWQRSYIDITGDAAAEVVTRAYALQRYVTACAGRGRFPIKFNGSIFTMQGPVEQKTGRILNADYRKWGGSYWFQNTRLIYWPLLHAGDWEMIRPWFDHFENVLPLARHRCREQFGIDGVFFPETMTIWGTYRNNDYGYDRPDDLSPGLPANRFIRRYWQNGLELASLMLAYFEHVGDGEWWQRQAYPIIRDVLRYYDGYYTKRDAQERIRFEPSQSLETWHEVVNPTPDIAGLMHVLDALLAINGDLVPKDERRFFEQFRDRLPPIPLGDVEGASGRCILPAAWYDDLQNMENCELYAVFPYPLGALGGDLETEAQRSHEARRLKQVCGWFQDAVHAAMLGRSDEAADMLTAALAPETASEAQLAWRKLAPLEGLRFPGFFGPNFDWVPDQDHGCVAMLALQKMLLQTQQGKLRVLPAWPARWNVRFRLYAPGQTIVEGDYRDGQVVALTVMPESRRDDLQLPKPVDVGSDYSSV
ncbi:MAG: DUF5703 domain-containing protein [bacterium]